MATRRTYFSNANATEISTSSSSVWSTACAVNFLPEPNTSYVVFWSTEAQTPAVTTTDVKIQVTTAGAQDVYFDQRPRTISEYGSFSGFYRFISGGSPVSTQILLQLQSGTNTVSVKCKNSSIVVLKLEANDVFSESNTRITTASAVTFTNAASITFTPPVAATYLLIGQSIVDTAANSAPINYRISNSTSCTATLSVGSGANTNLTPNLIIWQQDVPAVSQTFNYTISSNTAGIVGSQSNRLLALYQPDFDSVFYAEQGADSSAVLSTSFVTKLTSTQTVNANPYFTIGAWVGASTTNTVATVTTRFTDGGVAGPNSTKRTFSTGGNRQPEHAFSKIATGYTAAPRTWTIDQQGDGANTFIFKKNSAFAILDMGNRAASIPVTLASFATTPINYNPKAARVHPVTLNNVSVSTKNANLLYSKVVKIVTEALVETTTAVGLIKASKHPVTTTAIGLVLDAVRTLYSRSLVPSLSSFTAAVTNSNLLYNKVLSVNSTAFTQQVKNLSLVRSAVIPLITSSFVESVQNYRILQSHIQTVATKTFDATAIDHTFKRDYRVITETSIVDMVDEDLRLLLARSIHLSDVNYSAVARDINALRNIVARFSVHYDTTVGWNTKAARILPVGVDPYNVLRSPSAFFLGKAIDLKTVTTTLSLSDISFVAARIHRESTLAIAASFDWRDLKGYKIRPTKLAFVENLVNARLLYNVAIRLATTGNYTVLFNDIQFISFTPPEFERLIRILAEDRTIHVEHLDRTIRILNQ